MKEEKQKIGIRTSRIGVVTLAFAIILIGVIYMAMSSSGAAAQTVAAGDNISVYYTGTFQNGTVFDSNVGKQPLNFTVGSGELIKGFDEGVIGMKVNQTKNITLTPEEGYGLVNQSLIISVPKSVFGNQTISVGMQISNRNGQHGTVTEVNATNVTVDFNNPMAGKTLIFEIKVVAINKG